MPEGGYIVIDGELLDDALLVGATVIQELDNHWWCEVEYRQTPDKRFPAEDLLGKNISVAASDEQGERRQLFAGLIIESELEYEIYGSQRALLRAVSPSYLLDLTPRRAYYFQKTPQQVAQGIISGAGLSLDGTIEGQQLSYVQVDETDFRFLRRLVDGSEKWLRASEKGVEVKDFFQPGPTVDWRAEHGLVRFEVRGRLTTPAATGAHYDYRKMKSLVAEDVGDEPAVYDGSGRMFAAVKLQSSKFGSAYVSGRRRLLGMADLEPRLKKEVRRALGSTVVGRGVSRNQRIKAGDQVTIEGTLDGNGTYGVLRVVHSWTVNGYENEFLCTPTKKYTSPYPVPPPRFDGIAPARVVDNNDPHGIGRIQVQFYWQEDSHSCWIQWMTPHAGDDRGFLSLPEIGDEVWILFQEGDPERARVLGSAWNGVHQPPRDELWGGDVKANDVKRIVTKSGNRITLADKNDKNSIVLATPNHLKLSMIENSNETADAMLALHSNGDVLLSAPNGRINFRSKFFSREIGAAGTATEARSAIRVPVSVPSKPIPKPAISPTRPPSEPLPSGMTHEQKMIEAIRRSPISAELRRELGDIPTLVAQMVVIGGALAAIAATGYGALAEAIGAGLLLIGAAISGVQIGQGIQALYDFWEQSRCDRAKTTADLDRAGQSFARGIDKIGIGGLNLLLSLLAARGKSWTGEKFPRSTGRTTPTNLKEQLAMEQAKSNPDAGTPVPVKGGMKDPRWLASKGWLKMRQNINGVEIHYVRNAKSGAVDDFKFK